ncbi:MAG: SPOR domain-containing protein [Bacteroidales bacterium]|nr:SPOR domain-containing protein [Bacteroidales bacterium]
MRRITLIFSVLAASMLLLTGCDFMRALAGRPTSEEIEKRAALIKREQGILQARKDSALRVEAAIKREADSLALCDSLLHLGFAVDRPERLGGIAPGTYGYRYSVVVGAFSTIENAQKYAADYKEQKGYDAILIPTLKGYKKVGICHTNDIFEFWDSMKELIEKGYTYKEASILINEEAL